MTKPLALRRVNENINKEKKLDIKTHTDTLNYLWLVLTISFVLRICCVYFCSYIEELSFQNEYVRSKM